MRSHEILTESVSKKVYHYSPLHNAVKILQTKRFSLSAASGTDVELRMQRGDRPFYLSLARSPYGDFTLSSVYWSGVMFNLNGDWLNQRYAGGPVDYWERSWLASHAYKGEHGITRRFREMEDRIFSKDPHIVFPQNMTDLVKEIHVYARLGDPRFLEDDRYGPALRKLLIMAKTNGIPIFLYSGGRDKERGDETGALRDWLSQNKSKAIQLTPELLNGLKTKDVEPVEKRWTSNQAIRAAKTFKPWIELVHKNKTSELSKDAEDLRYKLMWYGRDSISSLSCDIHNYRKEHHDTIAKLLAAMRKLGARDVRTFVEKLMKKWSDIRESEHNAAKT